MAAISLSAITILDVPCTDEAADSARSFAEGAGEPLRWRSPGIIPGEATLDLGLDADGYGASMAEPGPRSSSQGVEAPYCLVDPDDPAVKEVARHVSELTRGMPDWRKVQAALNLVQTGVSYAYDDELYGVEDFWAKPAEVLFLKRGDCEDTSVLFCSVVLAMGLDAVLIDFPGHMAVGVRLDSVPGATGKASFEHGGRTWWYCETASDEPAGLGEMALDGDYVVWEPRGAGLGGAVVTAFAWWRSVIRAATGA